MVTNKMFENVAKLKCMGMRVMYQYSIYEEIKSRLSFGNVRCLLVQNLLFYHLLSKDLRD
jgi:hypothetical protein